MRILFTLLLVLAATAVQGKKNWDNGRLKVSENQRFLQFENGKPFFWLGEHANKVITFRPEKSETGIEDGVLIAIDASKTYLTKEQQQISAANYDGPVIDRNE